MKENNIVSDYVESSFILQIVVNMGTIIALSKNKIFGTK